MDGGPFRVVAASLVTVFLWWSIIFVVVVVALSMVRLSYWSIMSRGPVTVWVGLLLARTLVHAAWYRLLG